MPSPSRLLCSSVDAGDSSVPTWSGDANMTAESTTNSQWVFPISALSCTPTAQERSLHEEMYDRSRGIEFLYRLGTSIGLFVRRAANSSNPRFCRYAQPTLVSFPQPFPWPIHGCDVVPSLLYAVFYARLSSPSQSLVPTALVASSFVTNTSSDHRGRLRISCYKDRRVRKEAQGCS